MVELTVELNAKLQPIHRGEMFEEPLENVLIQANVGEVLGGGTVELRLLCISTERVI